MSAAGVTTAAAGALVAVLTANGFPAASVALDDAGIWVTNRTGLDIGRLNRQIDVLDASVGQGSRDFDVLQSGSTVLVVDRGGAQLKSVDPAYLRNSGAGDLTPGEQVALGGGTVARAFDKDGALWTGGISAMLSLKPDKDRKQATVGPHPAVTVGLDGSTYAVSPQKLTLWTVPGVAGEVTQEPLAGLDGAKTLEVTAVGDVPVVLDVERRRLVVRGQEPVDLSSFGGSPTLQQSGPAAGAVLVATDAALVEVQLDGTGARRLVSGAGRPSAPVRLGSCVHAAWSASASVYAKSCAGAPPRTQKVPDAPEDADLRFRVNRGQIVLNDAQSGGVWVVDDVLRRVDDWQKVKPQTRKNDQQDTKEEDRPQQQKRTERNRPPVAVADQMGARPGRSVVLSVLDNDTDPNNDVLAVTKVTGVPAGKGQVDLVRNGQALQFTPAAGITGAVTFSYTVTDGRNGTSSTTVTVTVRPDSENSRPALKADRTPRAVVEMGKSVQYDVLADWEDPDGDPLTLTAAGTSTPGDNVRFTANGLVTFVDGGTAPGRKKVAVVVTDGRQTAPGTLTVNVKPRGELPPDARDDLVVARVGVPVTLRPLLNDSDPNGDDLHLVSVKPFPGVGAAGAKLTTDAAAGTATLVASRVGTYLLVYTVTDGPATAEATVRIDVRGASGNTSPVAVADNVVAPEGGQALVDVLANDLDLDGDVLVVRSVTVPQGSGITVSVLDLRVVRVEADRPLATPVSVAYEISDGLASSTGSITVRTVASAAANQAPVTRDDLAFVRASDVVDIPVLANDRDPDGDRITLSPDLSLPKDAQGLLFVDGDHLRYQAPAEATSLTAVYTAIDARGARSSAQVTISVRGPDSAGRNEPPAAQAVEARVFAGATVRIEVPVDGIDPDGDSVTVTGIATAPRLGRVTSVEGGTTLVYQAFDRSAGTDSFTYVVRDALGLQARATVRVGVAPRPDLDQPPVAIDDVLKVRPGKHIAVPVLANDSDPDGDAISLDPVAPFSAPKGLKVSVLGDRLDLTVPDEQTSLSLTYAVVDGRGGRDTAFLTIEVSADAPSQPPVARDDVLLDRATARNVGGAPVVDVDVRSNDDDPDGVREDLRVAVVGPNAAAGTVGPDGHVVVRLSALPRSVAYTVTDVDGLTATAFVRVPGLGNEPPRLARADATVVAKADTATQIRLADYVVDPEGKAVRLTTVAGVSATNASGAPLVRDDTTLVFTPAKGYSGPAAITFEVTDGSGPADPKGATAMLSLPIDVRAASGRPPTFSGPVLPVAAGEPAVSVDLRDFVQDPDVADDGKHRFSDLAGAASGIKARLAGSQLTVSADASTPKGTQVRLTLAVTDGSTKPVAGTVTVQVRASTEPLAKANDDVVDAARQGEPVTVRVLANDANPFPGKPLKVTGVSVVAGGGSAVVRGDTVVYTPADTFFGTARLSYSVQDVTADPDREVTGRVSVSVQGKPLAPAAAPVLVGQVGNRTVTVRLSAPADQGSAITGYEVESDQGTSDTCVTDVCALTGLQNGTGYRFRYRAVNSVGPGGWSPYSAVMTPDTVPDAPAVPTASFVAGGTGEAVTLNWTKPSNQGTPVIDYVITVSPPSSGGATVTSTSTTKIVTGLNNGTQYTFTVAARNDAGTGPASAPSAPETPAGIPGVPGQPVAVNVGGALGGQAQVTWPAAADNGAAVTAYTLRVFRNGTLAQTVLTSQTSQTVNADNANDYTFDVSATNKSGTSAASPVSSALRVFKAPASIGSVSATPGDHLATLAFSAPDNGGQPIVRYEVSVSGGSWSTLAGNNVVSGLSNGTAYTFQVRACNTYCADPGAASGSMTPFGPLAAPGLATSNPSGNTVRFDWSVPAANGRGVSRIEYSVNGGGWTAAGAGNGSWTSPASFNASYSFRVRAVDNGGLAGAENSASNATATSYVTVVRGALHQIAGQCWTSPCGWVRVTLTNFNPGTYTAQVHASFDDFSAPQGRYTISVGANGTGVGDNQWLYGYPGKTVWAVTNNGVTAPGYIWPN